MNVINTILIILIGIIFHISTLLSHSPEFDNQEYYYERPSLLITPATGVPAVEDTIHWEITEAMTASIGDLGSFNIIDYNSIIPLFKENNIQSGKILADSLLTKIGRLVFARELMIFNIISFYQIDLQSAKKETGVTNQSKYLSRAVPKDSLLWEQRIQTHLLVQIKILDVEAGQPLETFNIEINHTQRSKEESRLGSLRKLRKIAVQELKKIYLLSTELVDSKGSAVVCNSGSGVGIQKGMLFVIRTPDQIREPSDELITELITIPGKPVGFVAASEVREDQTYFTILRQSGYFPPGYRAFEVPKRINGLRIAFNPSIVDSIMSLGVQYIWQPLRKWKYGLGMRLIRVTDSYGDHDYGVGMEGFGGIHLAGITKMKLAGILGIDFDLPFRKDDDENDIYLPVLSAEFGILLDIFHYWKTDISIMAGYRISSQIQDWKISKEEEEDQLIYWENTPPKVNISGPFIQIGYKYYFF